MASNSFNFRPLLQTLKDYELEAILLLSMSCLLIQLFWPTLEEYYYSPNPGCHVWEIRRDINTSCAVGLSNQYWLYLPKDYDSEKRRPLILYLHGSGQRGTDIEQVRKFGLPRELGTSFHLPAIVVSPQCLEGFDWNPYALHSFIYEIEKDYRIDSSRIYVMGHSMGGFGAWLMAATFPERIAAIVPLCGGGNPEMASSLRDVAIWAIHGTEDPVIPMYSSQMMVDAVRASGGDARLTLLEGKGHDIQEISFQEPKILDWLLSQQKH